jgi:hypothetical protein
MDTLVALCIYIIHIINGISGQIRGFEKVKTLRNATFGATVAVPAYNVMPSVSDNCIIFC